MSQTAAPMSVDIMIDKNTCGSLLARVESIIQPLIVSTTSPPAINAPLASNIAAIIIAPVSVRAFEPTAGHILFATSLAHMFIAMYKPSIAATNKNVL